MHLVETLVEFTIHRTYSDVLHLREEDSVGDLYHVVTEKLPALIQRPEEDKKVVQLEILQSKSSDQVWEPNNPDAGNSDAGNFFSFFFNVVYLFEFHARGIVVPSHTGWWKKIGPHLSSQKQIDLMRNSTENSLHKHCNIY